MALNWLKRAFRATGSTRPHVFRIDWTSSNVVYWIDGAKVATHNVVFAASVKMTVVGSDLYKTKGVLTIDWMRLGPYAASGTHIVEGVRRDHGGAWLTLSWTATTPAGTGVSTSYRTGSTPTPDAHGGHLRQWRARRAPLAGTSRYLQFRIQESTSVPAQTPTVTQVTIGFNR